MFSTRSQDRPNPIGLHVQVAAVDGLRVLVHDLEAFDGTPVVDVKPVLAGGRRSAGLVDQVRVASEGGDGGGGGVGHLVQDPEVQVVEIVAAVVVAGVGGAGVAAEAVRSWSLLGSPAPVNSPPPGCRRPRTRRGRSRLCAVSPTARPWPRSWSASTRSITSEPAGALGVAVVDQAPEVGGADHVEVEVEGDRSRSARLRPPT